MRVPILLALAACHGEDPALQPDLNGDTEPACPEGLAIGQCAPDFELPSAQGGTVRLSDWRGHRVAVVASGMG